MSWFFGKKKLGNEGPSATVSPKTFEEAEAFSIIESSSLYPILDDGGTGSAGPSGNISSLPYQVSAGGLDNQTKKPALLPSDSLPHHPLQDIPFKLNSQLDIDVTDLEVFLFNVNSVLTKIVSVNTNIIKYNFSTERSVINEEQSSLNEYS